MYRSGKRLLAWILVVMMCMTDLGYVRAETVSGNDVETEIEETSNSENQVNETVSENQIYETISENEVVKKSDSILALSVLKKIDYVERAKNNRVYMQESAGCSIASVACVEAYVVGTGVTESDNEAVYYEIKRYNDNSKEMNWSKVGWNSVSVSGDTKYQKLYDKLVATGLPVVIHRKDTASGHYAVVVGYEDKNGDSIPQNTEFLVLESQKYERLYDNEFGYDKDWEKNYDHASRVPLNEWESYCSGNFNQICWRESGVTLTSLRDDPLVSKLIVTCTKPEGELIRGNSFSIIGSVQSNKKITKVQATIFTAGGGIKYTKAVSPNKYNYSWGSPSILDNEMKFKELSTGDYSFELRAWDESGAEKAVTSRFKVIEKQNVVANQKPTIILNDSKNTLSETAAVRTAVVKNPNGSKVSEGGMILYNEAGTAIARCSEALNQYEKQVWLWYATDQQTKTNLNIKLIPGTTYSYEIYAKVGNDKCTVKGTFTTPGTAKPETPVLDCTKFEYAVGDIATVTWNAVENAINGYSVTVNSVDGTYSKVIDSNMNTASFALPQAGEYQVSIVAKGYAESDRGYFSKNLIAYDNCKVTFVEEKEDGTIQVLKEESVKYGRNATAPVAPSRTGWIFQGWDISYMTVKENITVKAVFVRNTYLVKFVGANDTVLKTERVEYEGTAQPPEDPKPENGYVFAGWDSEDYKCVTKNATIYASFIYKNKNLPIQLTVNSCTYDSNEEGQGEGYTVLYNITNYDQASTRGRVVVAIKGTDGHLVQTTESNAFTLRASQKKENVEIFVPCDKDAPDVEAATAEVVIVDGYGDKTGIPISDKRTVQVTRSWSNWSTAQPPAGVTTTESRVEYRYRDKSRTVSSTPSLDGWNYESTEGYWGEYGAWSGWSRNQYYASDSRQIESKTVTDVAGYMLQEYYFYKYYRNGGWWYSYANRSGEAGVSRVEFHNVWINTSGDSRTMVFEAMDDGRERYICNPYQFYQIEYFYKGAGQQWVAPVTHTEWRCRDRQYLYRYHFSKWSEWSSWSATPITGTDSREVETRTVYRYQANAALENTTSGVVRNVNGKVNSALAGKQAILFVYKYDEPSDSNNEYLGQTTIGADGSYSFSFITREEPSVKTGDFTMKLGIEGASELLYIGVIDAPKPDYSVKFMDWDGTILEEQTVKEGDAAKAPQAPVREGYRFIGWNSGLTNIHDDMQVVALYEREQCTVVFIDWGTKKTITETYDVGADIIYPVWKEIDGYEFIGWFDEQGNEVSKAEKNLVLSAAYEVKEYQVNFYDQSGELLSRQTVKYGEAAWAPEAPEIEGQRFACWSTYEYSSVKKNLDIFPSYEYYETTKAPEADIKSKTLSEPVEVTLSCEEENAVILYTLDGSDPDIFSAQYEHPITIEKNEVLKFMARSEGKNDSEIVSEAYLMQKTEDDAGALVIKKDSLNLLLGEEAPQITYFLYHENPDMPVLFYSLNEEVVGVDQEGNLFVNNVGSTQVFAITEDYRYADYCDIVVTSNEVAIQSFDITQKNLEMVIGEETDLATKITPDDATYQEVIWSSDDPQVVKIDEEGHLAAVSKGGAYITAYSYTGSNIAYCYVSVDDTTLSLNEQEITIAAGQKYQLHAVIRGGAQNVTWKSNDTSVASVTQDGQIEALSPGMATILATAENGDFRTCTVRVTSGEMAAQPPEAPQIESVTDTQIVVKVQAGCEYSLDAKRWQESNVFLGLTPDREYIVYSRVAATGNTLASPASKGTIVQTTETKIEIREIEDQTYTGRAICPDVFVTYKGEKLEKGKDYKVTYKNNVKISQTAPTVIVSGIGNYTGNVRKTFAIVGKNIGDEDIICSEILLAPNNKVQKPIPKLSYGKVKLKKGRDFTVTYPDETAGAYQKVGEYSIVITGQGNYTGSRTVTMNISDKTFMSKVKVDILSEITYNGELQYPDLTVTCKGSTLRPGADYEMVCTETQSGAYKLPGTHTVKLVGKGEYIGSRIVNYRINGISLKDARVLGVEPEVVYTGEHITQDSVTVMLEGYGTLKENEDYQVEYSKNVNAGKAAMTIIGINGFTGKIRKSYKICSYNMEKDEEGMLVFEEEPDTVTYRKGGAMPQYVLVFGGEYLKEGQDYTIKYSNNKSVNDGTNEKKIPTAIIRGKGNFTGTIAKTFVVEEQQMNQLTVKVSDVQYKNNNKFYKTKPVIYDLNGKKLVAGKDYDKSYTYTYADGSGIRAGEIPVAGSELKITITGKGNYTGSVSETYRVADSLIQKAKVEKIKKNYTGDAIELRSREIIVTLGGKKLVAEKDYEIVEDSYSRNVNPGTASVTIRGLGDYAGELKVNYAILKKNFY